MRSTFLCQKKADFFQIRNPDCEKTTRTISKIPKDSERARASPQNTFFILVSEFGKWMFRNILEIISKLKNLDFYQIRNPDCEKTTRTISKIPKDSERARASPKSAFFILVSEFGKMLFRNILEVVVSRILSFIFLIVGYRYNPFKQIWEILNYKKATL